MAPVTDVTAALLRPAASPVEAALNYARAGLLVLPLHTVSQGVCSCGKTGCASPGKHPRTARGLLDGTSDQESIRGWWQRWPDANVGLVTGPAAGLVVVDVDPRNGGEGALAELAAVGIPLKTLRVETGGGGAHLYFRYPGGSVRSRKGLRRGVDIQADGAYVVAPPSVHASGRVYRVVGPETPVAGLPAELLELIGATARSRNGGAPHSLIPAGRRNSVLASIAGRMRREGMSAPELEIELERVNLERCNPPLEASEVQKIARSIGRYPAAAGPGLESGTSDGGAKRPAQAARLVNLLSDAELFCSTEGEAFATIPCGNHRETWPLRAQGFKTWLMARYFDATHGAPSTHAVHSALGVLEGQARARGIVHPVCVRLAESNGLIYLDLGDERWDAVEIGPAGWRIVAHPPIKFRRSGAMLPLPAPVRGGALAELRRFITASDEDWRLIATWLLAALRPDGPYPMLLLHGEQGSAKSTTARALRALIDPAAAPLRAEPKDTRDLMIAATNGWVIALDNLSEVTPRLSDALCSLSTGAGFAARMLYTDDVEKIFSAERPVILNGIDEVATSGDLLERAIIVYLPHIPESQRRTMAELWGEFEAARPRMLGALLDAMVEGIRNLPSAPRAGLPRMADFARWGCAVAPVLGWDAESFLKSYEGNRDAASDLALEGSPVARMLLETDGPVPLPWEGTAAELLERLDARVKETTRRQREWPKNPRALSRTLRRLAPNLRTAGLEVEFLPRQGKRRPIRIESTEKLASLASPASRPAAPELEFDGWEQVEP